MFVHRFRDEALAEARRLKSAYAEDFKFLKTWASKPLTTGAVSPSGRALARAMAAGIDPSWPGVVVELGPGTGSVTAALLKHGVPPEKLVAIEYNPEFASHIRTRFHGVNVVVGDAYSLKTTLHLHGITEVAAVVSSLPLFTRPPLSRQDLIAQAMDLLPVGRPFVQFSYALVPPVPAKDGAWTLEVSDWILMNLPPARVWTYSKP
jgi:phosphatidylethanolamine/phosphatidyl-N-methylethanolamine N-methyltransferase